VSRYQKKHSPTHHPDHHLIFITFSHLLRSISSSLLKLRAWQSFCTTSFHVIFGLPLHLEPPTSYSTHFFTQSVSFFAAHAQTIATCFAVVSILYNLFLVFLSTLYLQLCLFLNITFVSDIAIFVLKRDVKLQLTNSLTLHIHLTILISVG